MSISSLLAECCFVKNATLEYGGFSPSQCRLGTNPSWGRALIFEDEAEKKRNDAKAHAPLKAKMYTIQAVFPQRISEAEPKN